VTERRTGGQNYDPQYRASVYVAASCGNKLRLNLGAGMGMGWGRNGINTVISFPVISAYSVICLTTKFIGFPLYWGAQTVTENFAAPYLGHGA